MTALNFIQSKGRRKSSKLNYSGVTLCGHTTANNFIYSSILVPTEYRHCVYFRFLNSPIHYI